jgi:hypothetical protein
MSRTFSTKNSSLLRVKVRRRWGLSWKATPDPRHRRLTHSDALGELACAPVRGSLGQFLQGRADQLLDALI